MKKKKILLGMSGGIDSTTSAKILLEMGYEVIGLYIKMLSGDGNKIKNVRQICTKLGIELKTVDVCREFKKEVIDQFVREYETGRTPNPCVICNPHIKFATLFMVARENNFSYVATGHYARIKKTKQGDKYIYGLSEAKDKKKDQSYFLYDLKQDQLSKMIFPLGEYLKKDVKDIAYKNDLFDKDNKESQDVCFIKNNDIRNFLTRYAHVLKKSGNIVDKDGNVIGKHDGLIYYTIGQRGKFSSLDLKKSSLQYKKDRIPPLYVIKLDIEKNELVLGLESDLYSNNLIVEDIDWINPNLLGSDFEAQAKIRSTGKKINCMVKKKGDRILVKFDKVQRAIASGQSIVFYQGEQVLGGGIIK